MGTTKSNETYSAVSLSGGKDSSCLLILMIEKGLPIDCVLYADTGMEFPEMEAHIAKLDDFLFRERGLHITTLRHPHGFEWLMFDVPQQQKRAIERRIAMGQPPTGYGWPGMRVRWCTGQLKTHLITKETNRLKKEKNALHHIGIAADEAHRCKDDPHNRYPLVEWGITEAQALQICYDRGYDWGGLYEKFHRVSCWCCPLQSLADCRVLYRDFPDLWEQLKRWDAMTWRSFKSDYTVLQLEQRFDFEDEWLKAGNRLGTKAFYSALRERLVELDGTEKHTDPRQPV